MKITKNIRKIAPNKTSSFWYYGCDNVIVAENKNKRFAVTPRGEIKLQFKENENSFQGYQALEEAQSRRFADRRLAKIQEFDGWSMNNWFVIVEIDKNDNEISDDLAICYDYDEALETLKEIAK